MLLETLDLPPHKHQSPISYKIYPPLHSVMLTNSLLWLDSLLWFDCHLWLESIEVYIGSNHSCYHTVIS